MNLVDILQILSEASAKVTTPKTASKVVKSRKGRVKVYKSIKDALSQGSYGQIFSTEGAGRLYVISKPKWGKKSTAGGNQKIAKGFTPGAATPSAKWDSIKAHAVRTLLRHGKDKSKRLTQKYTTGSEGKKEEKTNVAD